MKQSFFSRSEPGLYTVKNVTGYGKTDHSRHFVETEINTPSERTFIADHNGAFIISIGLSCAKL